MAATPKNTGVVSGNQEKAASFTALAKTRVKKARNAIRLISNLGSRNYVRTPQQIDKIEKVLSDDLKKCIADLRSGKEAAEGLDFEL